MASDNKYISELVREPREALDIEVKNWLDLTDNGVRAALAKEIIALANHGGGYIVIGFNEQDDGTFEPDLKQPRSMSAWAQDQVQSIVAKYIDPGIQCRVPHHLSPETGMTHPVIIVPGGHRMPIRAKAASPDGKKLFPHRTYIRRPGPSSEEPQTAEEWDRLLERCLQNRKAELLDAMRSIMEGRLPPVEPPTPPREATFDAFCKDADARWKGHIAALPTGAPPRFEHGYYDLAVDINGEFERVSLSKLRQIVQTEVRNHSGWPPFLTIHRPPHIPSPVDGTVECWIGPEPDGSFDKPSHHDFWRVSPDGFLFTRRGYQEDNGLYEMTPGKSLDITTPTWRLGEAVMEASYIARALKAESASLVCRCTWTGLAGRSLVSNGNQNRSIWNNYTATQAIFNTTETITVESLPGALPELVFAVLEPLYELFDFFQLPKQLVSEELARLLKNQF